MRGDNSKPSATVRFSQGQDTVLYFGAFNTFIVKVKAVGYMLVFSSIFEVRAHAFYMVSSLQIEVILVVIHLQQVSSLIKQSLFNDIFKKYS